jgi:tetratricopeptide (TPR) repeat protein
MIARLRSLLLALRRRPGFLVWLAIALAGGGFGAYTAGRAFQTERHARLAERHLEQADQAQRRAHLTLARDELSRSLEIAPGSARLHFLAARTARRLGDHPDASRHLEKAAQLGWVPEAVDLEHALGRAQRGDLDTVEDVLLSFIDRDHPDKPLILEALVQGYLGTYQLLRALACLDRWLSIQPDNTQALLWRGQTRLLLDRRDAALADYRRVVELDPEEDKGRRKLAEVLLSAHRTDEALLHFTRWRERQPDDSEALLGLARCQAEFARMDEAIDLLDRVLSRTPKHAAALALRGKLALEAGKTDEAERWLRRSLAVAPFERETLYRLHRCLQGQGRPEEAQKVLATLERIDADREHLNRLRSAVQKKPHDAALRYEMGRILLRNGQEREGRRWLESALREDPHHASARDALADSYEQPGDPTRTAPHR